jgi:hypothetical protein
MQLWVKGKSYWACHGEVLAFSSVEVLGAALGLQISGVGYAVVNRGCTVVGDRRLRHSRWSASERFTHKSRAGTVPPQIRAMVPAAARSFLITWISATPQSRGSTDDVHVHPSASVARRPSLIFVDELKTSHMCAEFFRIRSHMCALCPQARTSENNSAKGSSLPAFSRSMRLWVFG